MNDRITLINDNEIDAQPHADSDWCVHLIAKGGELERYCMYVRTRYDALGNEAMILARQCFRDTGSFAAISDTSTVPYVGKRMQVNSQCHAMELCEVICKRGMSWLVEFENGGKDWYSDKELLPLATPPAPKVRPLTIIEWAEAMHSGRSVTLGNGIICAIESVHQDHISLGILDTTCHQIKRSSERLAQEATFVDTGLPCEAVVDG